MQAEHTPTSLKPTRASFVRALPLSMPVEEVIERGREAGLELQPSDIHAARYYMRQAAVQATTPTTPKRAQRVFGAPVPPARATGETDGDPVEGNGLGEEEVERPPLAMTFKPRGAVVKTRVRKSIRSPESIEATAAADQQLRVLVLRLGTDRTRKIIEELESLPSRIVR